jgi:uncharacterized protein (TIGR01777 family)
LSSTGEIELLLTGASGLIGQALSRVERTTALPRRPPAGGGPWWEPMDGRVHGLDRPIQAVVHLAGENIAGGRWSKARMARIRDSRVVGTRTLVDALADGAQRPRVLVMASGISFYGDQDERELTESSPRGEGFLAQLSHDWEVEGERAAELGIRVVQLRLGAVLSGNGGALAKMLPAFRWCLGGPMGGGEQWFPWVHIGDVVRVIQWALQEPEAQGPYNLVAPQPIRQKDFAKTLGNVLGRPACIPAPAFALRMALGAMADEAILASVRALPDRLQRHGFEFQWSELEVALQDVLDLGSTERA